MKTIFSLIGTVIFGPHIVTAETDRSYVGHFQDGNVEFDEFLFSKKKEGKTWFWTEEEAKQAAIQQQDIKAKIAELQNQMS